jgi:electron transport complex protein RnfB
MLTVGLLIALVGGFGLLLEWAHRRYRPDDSTLINAIDALLPQTQCAQCGYLGCRPYAEAVAAGAAINLCPPGGTDTYHGLVELLGASVAQSPPPTPTRSTARIIEANCIGCFVCIPVCPVDAIVGAPQFMHTVLEDACTGCELCVPACPVDCIELIPTSPVAPNPESNRRRWPSAPDSACIRCGACQSECPVDLHPQQMFWFSNNAAVQSARQSTRQPDEWVSELERCIECGLCNQVCPSNIDLVGRFQQRRRALAELDHVETDALIARERSAHHQTRMDDKHNTQLGRRRERISERVERGWSQ